MIRDQELDQLPAAYAAALRLRAAGADDAGIAARLGLPPEAVPLLLTIAEAKLARLTENPDPSLPRHQSDPST